MVKRLIDKKSRIPPYLQLKDLLKYFISTGAIQENERLPGVMELAAELGINFETVRKILDSGDVLLATPGAGEEVRRPAPARLRIWDVGDHIDPPSLNIVKDRVLAML